MPRFRYKAITADGQVLRGETEAPTHQDVIHNLQQAGHLPVYAQQLKLGWLRPARPKFGSRQIMEWTRELATLLHAQVPLDQALVLLATPGRPQAQQQLTERLRQRLRDGASLSQAMAADQVVFGQLYLNMVRAGETAGSLDKGITRLATHLEKVAQVRAQIISALIYPVILVVIAVLSLAALMILVIPQFVPLFADSGKALPIMTQVVFAAAEFTRTTVPWLLLLAVPAALACYCARDNVLLRTWLDHKLLQLPLLGDLVYRVNLARFARALGTMLDSGVSILPAIREACTLFGNRSLRQQSASLALALEKGTSLSEALRQIPGLPPVFVQMIHIGEESGQLQAMLLRLAELFEQEVHRAIQRGLALLEPVLILGLGALIAISILSTLLAILGLNELVI